MNWCVVFFTLYLPYSNFMLCFFLGNVGKTYIGQYWQCLQGDHLVKNHVGNVGTGHPNSTILTQIHYKKYNLTKYFKNTMENKQSTNNKKNTIYKSEDDLQAKCIIAFQDHFFSYKEVLFHIFNNPRSEIQGVQLKAKGLKKGMPDLCLAVKNNTYGSLYIELKLPGEKPRPEQLTRHDFLRNFGNKVVVCTTVEEFINEVNLYINEP